MHENSMKLMREFAGQHPKFPRVLDVGSYDVNGTYRELFPGSEYVGVDVREGPGVDIVVEDPYEWDEVPMYHFDLVISGQCLEHVEYPWLVMEQIQQSMTPTALAIIIVPSEGGIHEYPIDCYRFKPDGMRALGKHADLEIIYQKLCDNEPWHDLITVFRRR